MSFLRMRNRFMTRGMNRRVATLAARLCLGVDTWKGIEATPSFSGRPLLTPAELAAVTSVKMEEMHSSYDLVLLELLANA